MRTAAVNASRFMWFRALLLEMGFVLVLSMAFLAANQKSAPLDHMKLHYDEFKAPPTAPQPPGDLSDLIRDRKAYYEDSVNRLMTNFQAHGLLLVLAIALALKGDSKKTFEVPGMHVSVPTGVMHLLASLALIYLWIQFGYLLSRAIDSRAALWHLYQGIDGHSPNSLFSRSSVLQDFGLMDGWFLMFRPKEMATMPEGTRATARFLMMALGAGIGMAHFLVLMLPVEYMRRFPPTSIWNWHLGMALAASILLGVTHWTFYFYGGHLNWLHSIVAGVCFAALSIYAVRQLRRHKP